MTSRTSILSPELSVRRVHLVAVLTGMCRTMLRIFFNRCSQVVSSLFFIIIPVPLSLSQLLLPEPEKWRDFATFMLNYLTLRTNTSLKCQITYERITVETRGARYLEERNVGNEKKVLTSSTIDALRRSGIPLPYILLKQVTKLISHSWGVDRWMPHMCCPCAWRIITSFWTVISIKWIAKTLITKIFTSTEIVTN